MVFPYMHHDLAGLLENPDVTFSEPQIKCYMIQLLEGTKYLHQVFVLFFFFVPSSAIRRWALEDLG